MAAVANELKPPKSLEEVELRVDFVEEGAVAGAVDRRTSWMRTIARAPESGSRRCREVAAGVLADASADHTDASTDGCVPATWLMAEIDGCAAALASDFFSVAVAGTSG